MYIYIYIYIYIYVYIYRRYSKKKRTCRIVDFTVPADHKLILKEGERVDKYLDLAREQKKLGDMKVTVIPIVIGTLGTIPKRLVKLVEDLEIRVKVKNIQTTALLRSTRIMRRVQET